MNPTPQISKIQAAVERGHTLTFYHELEKFRAEAMVEGYRKALADVSNYIAKL